MCTDQVMEVREWAGQHGGAWSRWTKRKWGIPRKQTIDVYGVRAQRCAQVLFSFKHLLKKTKKFWLWYLWLLQSTYVVRYPQAPCKHPSMHSCDLVWYDVICMYTYIHKFERSWSKFSRIVITTGAVKACPCIHGTAYYDVCISSSLRCFVRSGKKCASCMRRTVGPKTKELESLCNRQQSEVDMMRAQVCVWSILPRTVG